MKEIEFSEPYAKLEQHAFHTIRDIPCEINQGEELKVIVDGEDRGKAIVREKDTLKLEHIGDNLLTKDTDTTTREEAIEELREFYPYIKEEDRVAHITLSWAVEKGGTDD